MLFEGEKGKGSFQASTILRVLEAIPYGVSWAKLPGGEIEYCNAEFIRLFGFDAIEFGTATKLVESFFPDERLQRKVLNVWSNFEVPTGNGARVIADMELDVLTKGGTVRTVLLSGVILPDEHLAIAIFKDFSTVQSRRRQLLELARRDDLTGAANRRGLRDKWILETSAHPNRQLTFLMLDLDGFKIINDAHGHAIGDAVLRVIADRLKSVVRKEDLVCRLGGDEFGLLLVEPVNTHRIETICQGILHLIAVPIQIDNLALSVGISIGGCTYPDNARNMHELLQRADWALYQIKQSESKGLT
ncbi:sensor domain-containing diguanylate cyclase [Burkholderia vietnamiensis]|uniref:sensor domain-containing diguanylate cyclase n=1 Tax=Burkholderia vietnamiensis TaxID=60552 RepID=UPI001D140B26|nr:sensor domain-containing diguanylate cyclase [Burkholderia vietnamiensis]UEC01697.1 sensor domain-containing diguanylate cyclase [Burkholderia vietnamiensis]